jgi:hypothetical protein
LAAVPTLLLPLKLLLLLLLLLDNKIIKRRRCGRLLPLRPRMPRPDGSAAPGVLADQIPGRGRQALLEAQESTMRWFQSRYATKLKPPSTGERCK